MKKYNHQLFEDSSIRSSNRISQFSTIPENELKSFEISIGQQLIEFNNIISSNNLSEISIKISNLYNLINRGVKISDEIFQNEAFIQNLKLILFNPAYSIPSCKLLARILYYTNKFGVSLHDFILPLFKLFLDNIRNAEIESIVDLLCNLSSDLINYEFEDNYYNKDIVHPLKTIARNISSLIKATSELNFQISLSYILFIRHIANFTFPSDEEPFGQMIFYLKSLLLNPQVQQNDQFTKIILWTIYDICHRFFENWYGPVVDNNFIPFLVSFMKTKNFIFAEPILGIFYHIVGYVCLKQPTKEPIFNFDIPCIFALCLSSPEEPIQFEAFQFVHQLSEHYPFYVYSHNIMDLLIKASSMSCSYKVKVQILWIACILISRNDISYLTPESMRILLDFIVNNANLDEAHEYLAIESLTHFQRTMYLYRKVDLFDKLIAESGAADFIEELRNTTNEEIYNMIECYDNTADQIKDILETVQQYNSRSDLLANDDGVELSSDDIDMIEEQHMLSDDGDDDSNDNQEVSHPKIVFFFNPNHQ